MRKTLLLVSLLLMAFALKGQVKLESGLIIGGGKGSISTDLHPDFGKNIKLGNMKNKAHFLLGYRFRLKPVDSSFFYDLDLNAGVKLWGDDYYYSKNPEVPGGWSSSPGTDCTYVYGSFAGTANYRIYKGLSAGAGIEPRYYFYQSGTEMNKPAINVPVLAKLSYNFRFIELGLTYKFGVFNTLKNGYMDALKFNDWQLSIFIPF